MGVERIDYIFCGWKLPYEMPDSEGSRIIDWNESPYEEMSEDDTDNNFRLVIDGMSGEYAVFGKQISELDNDDGEGWEFVELEMTGNLKKDCIREYKKLFKMKPETDPTFFVFSHYH